MAHLLEMPPFSEIDDFYGFDEKLDHEELGIRNTIREIIDKETVGGKKVREILKECNAEGGAVPVELMRKFAYYGFIGANIPDEDGDRCSNLAYGIINREIEAVDSALRSYISVQSGLVMYPILRFGSDEQKKRWLEPLRKLEAVGCFGLTEKRGSDPKNIESTAEEKQDCFLLTGFKRWITNAVSADVTILWAKLRGEMRAFLVEKGTPGFTPNLIKHKGSLRASESGEIFFTNGCKIPKENMLPGVSGVQSAYSCLNKARYGIAWGTAGILRSCYKNILPILDSGVSFEKPLTGKQLIQEQLGFIDERIVDIIGRCFQLADRADKYDENPTDKNEEKLGFQISQAKKRCVELAIEATDYCVQLSGADGTTYDYPFWAHYANLAGAVRTYEGTRNMHVLIQGKRITGKAAF